MKEFERRLSRGKETQSMLRKWKRTGEQRDAYFQR